MYFSIFYHFISYLCQLDKATIQDMYKKMTLLNTMDRILYESQRQVRLTVCQVNFSKTSSKKYSWISIIKEATLRGTGKWLVNGGDNNRRTLGGMAKRWLQPIDGGTNVANGGLIDNIVLQVWYLD